MTRYKFTLSAVSLAVALGAIPALAGQAGGRPSGGSPSTGTATSSGGGTTTSSSSSSSSSGSASSGSSSSGSSGSSYTPPEPRASYGRDAGVERAPQRPSGDRPSGGRSSGGERAVPRGNAGGGEGGGRVASTPSRSGDVDRMAAPERHAVPSYSRPRDGRMPLAQAGVRTSPIVDVRRSGYFYDPYYGGYYYDPYGYFSYYNYGNFWNRRSLSWPGYGLGMSYFYDPFYDPFWYGGMVGYGGMGYGGYPGYYGGSYGGYTSSYRDTGGLRLKVKPRDAQVLVDGYFVGTVDDFDGVFQKLNVDAGSHRIELRAPGFAPVEFEVMVSPGETITYKGDMRAIQ